MGPSMARSVPGSISTRPSGFASSEAIFASIFDAASPTDPVRPVTALISSRSRSPTSRADAASQAVSPASRSTNASSRLSGSTSGDSARSRPITCSLTSRYSRKRGTRYAALGASLRACPIGIAECTPNTRASYEAVATTPRGPIPPTTTAFPRRLGFDACSAEA